jgi:predicted GNAT superfamily acetyltransferase
VHFKILATIDDLLHAERLQEEVFGVSERDLIPANELVVVPETGGAVLAAFLPDEADHAAGVLLGLGGFVGRPRIVSDLLAVRADARNLGLGEALKHLQAALALQRGFAEIVWTVDPLRAANARLNFAKLGATASAYAINRYGSSFAPGLYGALPSDRLHVQWEIGSPRVIDRLLGRAAPYETSLAPLPPFVPGTPEDAVRVEIPADIDALLAANPEQAMAWRLRLRDTLSRAFAEGFAITGFLRATAGAGPAYVLERVTSES